MWKGWTQEGRSANTSDSRSWGLQTPERPEKEPKNKHRTFQDGKALPEHGMQPFPALPRTPLAPGPVLLGVVLSQTAAPHPSIPLPKLPKLPLKYPELWGENQDVQITERIKIGVQDLWDPWIYGTDGLRADPPAGLEWEALAWKHWDGSTEIKLWDGSTWTLGWKFWDKALG